MVHHSCCTTLHYSINNSIEIRRLGARFPWHSMCQELYMHMNTHLLQEISYQIVDGNPWWGMALANEYLDTEDYLHRAFSVRFLTRAKLALGKHELSKALSEGVKTSELPIELQAQIGTRSVRTPLVIPLPRKRTQKTRLAVRERFTTHSNFQMTARTSERRRPARTAQRLSIVGM